MASPNPLSEANTSFSMAFFKKLSEEDKTGNVFYSPFSISSALAMVLLGARGNTATQMSEVLCFIEAENPKESAVELQVQSQRRMPMQTQDKSRLPLYLQKMMQNRESGQDDVHDNFAQLMSGILMPGAPNSLSIANRLYGEQTYKFVEDFLAQTRKYYSAELESVDFIANAEKARLKINSWVEEQTKGKITDLLVRGIVDTLTKLVLVNAIYFKGKWSSPFVEEFTHEVPFRLSKNDSKPVMMMYQKSKFPFIEIPEANCKILELPYEGKDLSMLILLPQDIKDETTGLEKLEKELTYETFAEWTRPDKMSQIEIEVKLPRFKLKETYDLKKILVGMGMEDAFDISMSDFSGMSPANNLVLSKVIHKAFIEVNEEGTEAAAATAVVMEVRSVRIPFTFFADHPFLFYIRHNPTKSILFTGRYSSPEE